MKKEVKVFDSEIEYTTDFRNVKYPRLEFRTGTLQLILPKNYEDEKFLLEKHKKWIKEKNKLIKNALIAAKNKKLKERKLEKLKNIVKKDCEKHSNKIKKVYFRKMKSKWASLSSNKNLTANTLLRYLPDDLIRYVIYHELIHLKQKRHDEIFWKIINSRFRDYEKKEKDLFIYWFALQNKFRKGR